MEFITVMVIMAIILGVPGIIYLADPKGWNATARRLSTITRANLESGAKPKAVTGFDPKADWDAQFEGKELVLPVEQQKPHEIVKTRITKLNTPFMEYTHRYNWWCRCGAYNSHITEEYALRLFTRDHMTEVKKQEALDKKKEEYRKKGLDREW